MLKTTLPILTVLLSAHTASTATLKPIQPETFFVQPDQPANLRWQVVSGEVDGPVQTVVHDYHDRPVATQTYAPEHIPAEPQPTAEQLIAEAATPQPVREELDEARETTGAGTR